MVKKVYDLNEVRKKIEHYCAYQDRCQKEVQKKLKDMGVGDNARDLLIMELIEHNFLDELRYAEAYVSGKFRIKRWGRQKIKQKLKFNMISDYCIKKALTQIDESEYRSVLETLLTKKTSEYLSKGYNTFISRQKATQYCYNRGYEMDIIYEAYAID